MKFSTKALYALSIFITFVFLLCVYYDLQQPKPITVKAEIPDLMLTSKNENAKPDNLDVRFRYDLSNLNKDQKRPTGIPSVARIDLAGEKIVSGITLSPNKKGIWRWKNDNEMTFSPETDWPAGTTYKVIFDKNIFSSETKLSEKRYDFTTPFFKVSSDSMELYQDPQGIKVRRVVSTLHFTHPVDKASLEKNISMWINRYSGDDTEPAKPYKFDITYDKNLREAYIQSEAVTLTTGARYVAVDIKGGIKSILGGKPSVIKTTRKILIPDIYSFFKMSSVNMKIIKNKDNEPEQVLLLEFNDDVQEEELLSKFSASLLPAGTNLEHADLIPEEIFANRKKVDFKVLPNKRGYSKLYSFVFDLPEERKIYIEIEPRLTSANSFIRADSYKRVLKTPSYPKEIVIAGEGSILTYSGDHKLNILTRGLTTLKYSVGKLLEGQLSHLITQTKGDISSPRFSNLKFNKENIAEFSEEIVEVRETNPKKPNYSSLDLTQFLPQRHGRFGLFFVDVRAWDPSKKETLYGASDSRLILVTDLGVIVKNNANHTHDVFVQSIQTGDPVPEATVELLGRNGIALYTRKTRDQGHVEFPSTKDFKKEKEPVAYVVRTSEDISFIPFEKRSRQINLSKFDIGGLTPEPNKKNALNAYLFSDRGVYRPGEEINIGMIVKSYDFSNVEGIPLEAEVLGPKGNVIKVQKLMLPEKGFADFQFLTNSTSDTGRYRVSLHLVSDKKHRGISIGSVDFKVEEFQPDTMRIKSELIDIKDKGWSNKHNIEAKVFLQNLFGTPAQNRKVTGQVIVKPSNFIFPKFKEFQFTDPFFDKNKKSLNLNNMLEMQKTNADGLAIFDVDLQQFKSGTYSLQFVSKGFDQSGGRSVASSTMAQISPLSYLVGHKADGELGYINTDSKRNIEFIVIDSELNQITKSNFTLRQVSIQHVSTLVKQKNGTYKYQSVKKEKKLYSKPFQIGKDGYVLTINTGSPGDYAVEVYDLEGRRVSRVEYSVVGDGNLAGKLDKNSELQLKLDKEDYFPGELIEMNIKAPYLGAGLITIETDKVHHFKWFKTGSESTTQTIRLPEGIEGTGYVNVSFVRDVGSKKIFTSPLSYAVVPFSIDRSKRKIELDLDVEAIVRPGQSMEISYTASKKSKIAVFAVDEGILQVANYKTPDPLEYFLKKKSLAVETLQILDLILPEFDLIKQLSASGGGERAMKLVAKNLNPFSRKTDKPAVFWSGIHNAGPESNKVSFDIPNTFAGSLKVMAVVVSEEAVGATMKKTIVRGPFVISPHVITHAAPKDEFLVTVGIANLIEGSGKNAEVDISVKGSRHLEVLGNSIAKLRIDEGAEKKLTFRIKTNNILGAAELTFRAKHKGEEAYRVSSLSIRPAMPYYTSIQSGSDQDGEVTLPVKRNLYASLASQSVSASASPLLLASGLSSYLANFPHGCTEQVVSQVFPLLGLMTHPTYMSYEGDVQTHFSRVIRILRERQLQDGSFSLWPGGGSTAVYPSIYAMHFLIEAKDLGYSVPKDLVNRGKGYLLDYVQTPGHLTETLYRANAIYLLTRLGVVTTNYLTDLHESFKGEILPEETLSASYMAATYKILQKDYAADKLISEYMIGDSHRKNIDVYHSLLAQDAQYLYLLAKHFEVKAKKLSDEYLLGLTEKIFKGEYNTISSAYSILALSAYSKLVLKNEINENIVFSSLHKDGSKSILKSELKPFLTADYALDTQEVKVEGEKPLYFLNVQSGFDLDLPIRTMKEGVEIYRDFLDDKGNKVTSYEQGAEITVRLKIRVLGDKELTNIAVIDLLPGGFEVIRNSIPSTARDGDADYINVREDRVIFYGTFDSTVSELSYKVKLTSAGDFVIPPAYAESMYDRSIRAISEVGRFKVTATQ